MASSAIPKARKPVGRENHASSGRLRLTILFATVAAFFLVPAAQAFAEDTATIAVSGTGSGEVSSVGGAPPASPGEPEGEFEGTPPIECSYASPGPATGVCSTSIVSRGGEFEEFFEEVFGYRAIWVQAIPAPGSELASLTLSEGTPFYCGAGGHPHECFAHASEHGDIKIAATFNVATPKFALTVARTGEGTVASSPAGIECGSECKAEFNQGSTVTLTASPASGYAFNSWAGCTEHVGLTCKVTMSKALTVKASFVATPSLTVTKAGSGQGKASATGISCDENCSSASSAIKTGTSVTVKVASAKGSEPAVFEGGTGSASGCSGATCTFTISEDSSVKVNFEPKPTNRLVVNLTGPAAYKGKVTGKGTIKGLTASAISCGSGCINQTESFFEGDTVTLSAVAGTGYKFAGWVGVGTGTCEGTTTPCTVSTNTEHTLSARFE